MAAIPQHDNKAARRQAHALLSIHFHFLSRTNNANAHWFVLCFSQVSGVIQQCRRAGIEIKMLTGDSLQTAVAVARATGILLEQV
jgi:hypothetical protein